MDFVICKRHSSFHQDIENDDLPNEKGVDDLKQEATELKKILSAIIDKS